VIAAGNISSGFLVFTRLPLPTARLCQLHLPGADTGGTANGGVDLDCFGDTITVKSPSVNECARRPDKTITTLEDTAYSFTAADFGFRPERCPANTLLAVKITTLPAAGSLAWRRVLRAGPVSAGQFVSAADITFLRFTPAANANGANYANFTFQVQDNGGTANGGIDLDASPIRSRSNVTSVNDAPAGTNKTITTLEDTAYSFTAADFGFTDRTIPRRTRCWR